MKSIAELKESYTMSDLHLESDSNAGHDYSKEKDELEEEDYDKDEIADETRPLQQEPHQQQNELLLPLILRLDIKVAENEIRQLVIDRTLEDPWKKA